MTMRQHLASSVALTLLACLVTGPAAAEAPPHPTPAPPPAKPAVPRRPIVALESYDSPDVERVIVHLGASPDPDLRVVPGGIELRIDDRWAFGLTHYRGLRAVTGIELREENGKAVALLRLACECEAKTAHVGAMFTLDLRPKASTSAKVGAPAKGAAPPAPKVDAGLDHLRDTLTSKLAQLNAQPVSSPSRLAGPQAGAPSDVTASGPGAATPLVAARPACPASFDMNTWKGQGSFPDRLVVLRAQAADTHESAPAMAALAEFYLAYGLAAEALTTLQEAQPPQSPDADQPQFARIADIAHLLRREPIAASSTLLADLASCAPVDLPLWRALAAAATHDAKGVARDAEAARAVLSNVPEPLLQLFAFTLAEAADDDVAVLRAMASAVRNTNIDSPEAESARFLIQARIAHAEGDAADEAAFLTRAAAHDGTVPGVTAKVELAALRARQDGPAAAGAEMVLADVARVYRSETVGQTAAAYLAERRLRLGDYATALAVADASAGPVGARRTDSRGAAMAAKILRKLLVEPAGNAPPDRGERLALYWRYEGYATPGAQGDDIRLGAARAMLAEDMPAAALDLLETIAVSPETMLLRATAEARAGDATAALLMLQALPADDAVHRIMADALLRVGRPNEAAQQLDGLADLSDRVRRTALLVAATDWPAAASACDALLHDPALDGALRHEVADRYSLAAALAGRPADPEVTAEPGSLAASVLPALPTTDNDPAADGPASLTGMRSALARARQIETLLPQIDPKQGS